MDILLKIVVFIASFFKFSSTKHNSFITFEYIQFYCKSKRNIFKHTKEHTKELSIVVYLMYQIIE